MDKAVEFVNEMSSKLTPTAVMQHKHVSIQCYTEAFGIVWVRTMTETVHMATIASVTFASAE